MEKIVLNEKKDVRMNKIMDEQEKEWKD